jgi:hypothetical protein
MDGGRAVTKAAYGYAHRKRRAALLPFALGTRCPIGGPKCDGVMTNPRRMQLDHSVPVVYGGLVGDRIVCMPCNAGMGQALAVQRRSPDRKATPVLEKIALGIEIAEDRSRTSIVAAGWAEDDVVLVELVAYLQRNTPAVDEVQRLRRDRHVLGVAIDPHSPAATLIRPLTDARVKVHEPTTRDVVVAHGGFVDRVNAGRLRHIARPELDTAVRVGLQRPLGGGTAWARRGVAGDVGPLVAAELATWLLTEKNPDYDVMSSAW